MNPLDNSPRAQLNVLLNALSDAKGALFACEAAVEQRKGYYNSPKTNAGQALAKVREELAEDHDVEATVLEAAFEDFCEDLELPHEDDTANVRWTKVRHSLVLVLSCSRNDGEDRDFTPTVNEGETGPLFLNLDTFKAEVLQWMSEAVPEEPKQETAAQ